MGTFGPASVSEIPSSCPKKPLQADIRERSRLRKQLSPNPIHSSARISKRRVFQVFQTLDRIMLPPSVRSLRWEETRGEEGAGWIPFLAMAFSWAEVPANRRERAGASQHVCGGAFRRTCRFGSW